MNLAEFYLLYYIKVYARGESGDLNSIRRVKLLEKYKDGMKGEIE